MSSLIDVSFLLLIFFIATSSLLPKEADLSVLKSPTEKGGIVMPDYNITITDEGMILGNDETLEMDPNARHLPALFDRLRIYKSVALSSGDEPSVTLTAQDGARAQRLVDVLNCLASLEIKNVAMTKLLGSE